MTDKKIKAILDRINKDLSVKRYQDLAKRKGWNSLQLIESLLNAYNVPKYNMKQNKRITTTTYEQQREILNLFK